MKIVLHSTSVCVERQVTGKRKGVAAIGSWPGMKINDRYSARKLPSHRILQTQMLRCPPSVTRGPDPAGRERPLPGAHAPAARALISRLKYVAQPARDSRWPH